MADYDPLIPAANDLISDSQGDIQNNFTELNTLFDRDHQKWNANTSAFRGKHRKMTFPEAYTSGTIPGLGSDLGILFPMVDPVDTSARPQMYYKNATETQQVTNRFHSASANGYVMLPGGIILMWGTHVGPIGSGTVAVQFNTISSYTGIAANSFPTACWQVFLTGEVNDDTAKSQNIDTGTIAVNGFTAQISGSIANLRWLAIGN